MRIIYLILFGLVTCFASLFAYQIGYDRFEKISLSASKERLSLYQATLRSTLERVSHLPRVVSVYPDISKTMNGEGDNRDINAYLKTINASADTAALFVMNADGETVAASNYELPESFIGKNYGFRAYFKQAMNGEQGRFFAIGATTGRPGYFISEPILDGAKLIGVAVVKIEFDGLLADWENAGENVFITDNDGIIVLSSDRNQTYKSIKPLPDARLNELQKSRKFAGRKIEMLDFNSSISSFVGQVEMGNAPFYVLSTAIPQLNWQLHYLTPLESVATSALTLAAFVFLAGGLSLLGVLYIRSRNRQDKLETAANEAKRIQAVNVQLEQEVQTRRLAEKKLRETQAELIQSSRLAALGKMSAAIVHEVNQPVSAIRTFTSSGALLLKKKRFEEADGVFQQIKTMTERLGNITSDLLVFSRKPVSEPRSVDLNAAVRLIAREFEPELLAGDVTLELDLDNNEALVKGSSVRFEQLISNLLKNSIQACEGRANSYISIKTQVLEHSVFLIVRDNGEGVAPEIMDQLFDPFFTTKAVGKGVGLGLALSYAIADEAGGSLRCENHIDGGACFTLETPRAVTESIKNTKEAADV